MLAMKRSCTISPAAKPPELDGRWGSGVWHDVQPLAIAHFHPKSGIHRPAAEVKIIHSDEGLHVLFRVPDRFVRVVNTGFQSPVWKDSCVEFFVRPGGTGGYFNFEMNAGGSLLACFIEDWTRTPDGFAKFRRLGAKWDEAIPRFHSLPEKIEPQILQPVLWTVQYTVPWALFSELAGAKRPQPGETWTGNFYKCGDETSHPHWAAWSPIGETLNFHSPEFFGGLAFG